MATSDSTDARVYNGRYEIQRHVARGGMAEVYLAHDLLLDRPVALKVLFPELSVDRSFVERFRREAQAAANLSNQHIVSIYDWGEEDGTYFIVMEYVDGRPLSQVIKQEGRLLPERSAALGAQVAAALAFAHRHGVVHRDVKPGNVLLDNHGAVKVTDFGIARAGDTSENLTQTGAVMGTATYFSPEQAQGFPVDPRSDVYSLGVVLYEMVTGRVPFTGETPVSIAYKHVKEPVPPPRSVEPACPPALEAVIMHCLEKDRDDRYTSAEELRSDLLRFVRGQTPRAARAVASAPPAVDQTVAVPTAAAAATTLMAPVAKPRQKVTVPPIDTVPAEVAQDRQPRTGLFVGISLFLLAVLAILLFLLARTFGLVSTTDTAAAAVKVPSVVDSTETAGRKVLEDAGFKVVANDTTDTAKPVGAITAQDPAGNATAGKGSTVTITVNRMSSNATVPNVANLQQDAATQALTEAGFTVQVVLMRNEAITEGFVYQQDPAPGAAAPLQSAVKITVSTGKSLAPVPDVTNMSQTDATNALSAAGYKVAVSKTKEASDTVAAGMVTRTDPAAGATLAKGQTTVTLILSSGPSATTSTSSSTKVSVPDVRGLSEADARSRLDGAGLVAAVSYTPVTTASQDGVVRGQNPGAGVKVESGATIVLSVGRLQDAPSTTTRATTTTTVTTTSSSTTVKSTTSTSPSTTGPTTTKP